MSGIVLTPQERLVVDGFRALIDVGAAAGIGCRQCGIVWEPGERPPCRDVCLAPVSWFRKIAHVG